MLLPNEAAFVLSRLEGAGYEAFVVGGAVRDMLRGVPASDWDITTSARPGQIEAVFSDCRVIETGIRHGTVTVLSGNMPIEITTYRTDGEYRDCRHPDEVHFTASIKEDLQRRDFTMNAIAYNPKHGFVDPFGGQNDIKAGVIRAVGDPVRRFSEDALRILRAIRFASALGMQIAPETARAVHSERELLGHVAAERQREELLKLLCGADVESVLIEFSDVIAVCVPEISASIGFCQHNSHHTRDVWGHIACAVAAIPADPLLRMTMLLHDIGKPACFTLDEDGIGHFFGHAAVGGEMADKALRRLRFDNDTRERIKALVSHHDYPITPEEKPLRRMLRRFGEEMTRQLITVHRADVSALAPPYCDDTAALALAGQMLDKILASDACFSLRDLAINGDDLLSLGLSGKEIGESLERCLTAVTEGDVPNEREALLELLNAAPKM